MQFQIVSKHSVPMGIIRRRGSPCLLCRRSGAGGTGARGVQDPSHREATSL